LSQNLGFPIRQPFQRRIRPDERTIAFSIKVFRPRLEFRAF
jgi:hypothetical protein